MVRRADIGIWLCSGCEAGQKPKGKMPNGLREYQEAKKRVVEVNRKEKGGL
jgi:ribosomal protein L37AE/L43A